MIEGTFIEELNNRFLCKVLIEGHEEVCYIPSSCRLDNFIELKNKNVLLKPVATKKSRTNYSVFAVKYKRSYLLLNTSVANNVFFDNLHSRRFSELGTRKSIKKEKNVGAYRSDLFIEDTNTIIEIKSIISADERAIFPTVYSERAVTQLKKINHLLEDGYHVFYYFVSLNPYCMEISVNDSDEYHDLFLACINNGMQARAFSLRYTKGSIKVHRQIIINYNIKNAIV